jgi:hypothetical protein
MSIPQAQSRPQVTMIFECDEQGVDRGPFLSSFEYKAMVNGGYIIRGKLFDTNFNRLDELIKLGYFSSTRDASKPVKVYFQLRWGPATEAKYPNNATQQRIACLLTLKHCSSDSSDKGLIEFVAIDPPSYFLNMGDAGGQAYQGKASDVIQQVIGDYAPNITTDISKTTDSESNKWWLHRQDPKTFISSIIDWSSSITEQKTHWIFNPKDFNLSLVEQAQLQSKQRAYYRLLSDKNHSDIRTWDLLADHGLSLTQTKLVTQGISAVSGQYLDKITDQNEQKLFATDARTSNKQIAKIAKKRGFTKPPDAPGSGPPSIGWSSISGIPEIWSAGDLGIRYEDYIDGRPRGMYLNMINSIMRAKFQVIGHGEWSDCDGLGVDTVYIDWTKGKPSNGDQDTFYWMTGNWVVYGFHHKLTRSFWYTDVYCARFDFNANAKKVGSGN